MTKKNEKMKKIVGLIPARSGSKRVPGKNIKRLGEHPLIAYTINAAMKSNIFDAIYVSTDGIEIGKVAEYYGANVISRPRFLAEDDSCDLDWVRHALEEIDPFEHFAILRPTNPFRSAGMIQEAWELYQEGKCDSIRAVSKVNEHPMKMFVDFNGYLEPILGFKENRLFDLPTNTLATYYVQNGALQISRTSITKKGYVTGERIIPFVCGEIEGFDINTEKDWVYAEWLMREGTHRVSIARLPYGLTL